MNFPAALMNFLFGWTFSKDSPKEASNPKGLPVIKMKAVWTGSKCEWKIANFSEIIKDAKWEKDFRHIEAWLPKEHAMMMGIPARLLYGEVLLTETSYKTGSNWGCLHPTNESSFVHQKSEGFNVEKNNEA